MIDHDNLEEYADPVDYDWRYSSDTGVAFYSALAWEAGGPVLEIACGTGRVAIPIARQGFAVTGLDVVPAMLERARFKAEAAGLSVRWVEDDARRFDLDSERFRLIFLTGNAFQAFLTNADQEALLGRVRAHLHDEGLFAFETRNPRWRTSEGRDEDPDGLFVYLETRAEEEGCRPTPTPTVVRCASRGAAPTTTSARSCIGLHTSAGTRGAGRSARRPRASRCATPSRRSSRRWCTTTASPSRGATASGTASP